MKKDNGVKLNALDEELQRWGAKEQMHQRTFGAATTQSKAYLKVKYKHLRNLQRQFKSSQDKDVKSSLKVLKAHLRSTRRQLYPWWQRATVDVVRTVWKAATFLFKQTRNAAKKAIERQRARRRVSNASYDNKVIGINTQQPGTTQNISQPVKQPLLKLRRRDQPRTMLNAPRMGKGIS